MLSDAEEEGKLVEVETAKARELWVSTNKMWCPDFHETRDQILQF